jgi:hypothetical protein
MSDLLDRVERLAWQMEQFRQLRGACSCGDSTILGVIHSDTKPCSLPTVYLPLTDHQIQDIGVNYADLGGDIGCKNWEQFARAIEKAHGIGGINEV